MNDDRRFRGKLHRGRICGGMRLRRLRQNAFVDRRDRQRVPIFQLIRMPTGRPRSPRGVPAEQARPRPACAAHDPLGPVTVLDALRRDDDLRLSDPRVIRTSVAASLHGFRRMVIVDGPWRQQQLVPNWPIARRCASSGRAPARSRQPMHGHIGHAGQTEEHRSSSTGAASIRMQRSLAGGLSLQADELRCQSPTGILRPDPRRSGAKSLTWPPSARRPGPRIPVTTAN